MIGRYEYPCVIGLDGAGGFVTAFPDIPEAISGAERYTALNAEAAKALVTALNFCVEAGNPLPVRRSV